MTGRDKKSFAIFVLTHGRPFDVVTVESLRESGYTGKIYIIIDNEDPTAPQYYANFSDDVIMFDKEAIGRTFDLADTQQDRRATVFARNASFGIAKQLGLDYYAQFDDDYTAFRHRFMRDNVLRSTPIKSMDKVVDAMLALLDDTNATSVAMSQGGDFIGGAGNPRIAQRLIRKAMNSWFFRTDRPITFVGRMNDDVNSYVNYGVRGEVFLTSMAIMLTQLPTQIVTGGMSEIYAASGTYMKTMYTVMMQPSCTKVCFMGLVNPRMHHSIRGDNAYPKIINERYVKK